MRFWLAKEGASFALDAFARAMTIHTEATDQHLTLVEKDPKDAPWWRTRVANGWRGLRTLAVSASDADHESLQKQAELLVHNASPKAAALIAIGFERVDWCDAIVDAMPKGTDIPAWFWPLLASTKSFPEFEALLKRAHQPHAWYLAAGIDELRFDLVARFGAEHRPFFCDTIEAASTSGVERQRSLAEALALVVNEDVAAFFVKHLAEKELRAIAATYLQAHPAIALVPVAEAAAQKGAAAEVAKAVLRPIVASMKSENPDFLGATKALLSPAAAHLIDHLEEQSAEREEASVDLLPKVLREPPWTTKRTLAPPIVVTLTPLPFVESVKWKPGEREQRLSTGSWLDEQPNQVEANLKKIAAQAVSTEAPNERSWNMQNASIFANLPKDALVQLPATLDLSRFSWAYYNVMSVLVARHGVDSLDFVLRAAHFDVISAVESLAYVDSPRVAPLMADAFARLKKAKQTATEWLLMFPEAAATGLLPLALGAPGKARVAAETALRFLSARGQRATIEGVAKKYASQDPRAEAGARAVLDFDPLLTFPSKMPKMPAFWNATALTRPLLADRKHALPVAAVESIGTMLAFTSVDETYPGLHDVKSACDASSLGELAWDLFQAWLVAGAPSKESWAFTALGIFGDDECARKLTPLVRAWPGEAAHARAVTGLDVLARIGTDVALMHLHGIAQKLKFKGLQEKAREKIDQIAEARGLSADELADRLVPDLGLDETGSLTLDFGSRTFKVVFDETLKPAVIDETGKRLPDLPKPKQTDDAEKAKDATDRWKALKKDAKTIAAGQITRLEIAMCTQRRWPRDVFIRFLFEHPLLIHVVRRLVWGIYDSTGKLAQTFRIAEDRSFADANDDAFTLPEDATLGIVHRLDLDDADASKWGQIFADYEVLQPFTQLSREISIPTSAEKTGQKLERVVGVQVPTGKVLGLDHRGWRRGPAQDGGVVCWYEKALSNGRTACLDLDPGIFTGMVSEAPEQKLGVLTVSQGGRGWYRDEKTLSLGELSPIDFSELLRDLDSLRA